MGRWIRPAIPLATILLGLLLKLGGQAWLADRLWLVGLIISGAPVVWQTLRGALTGHFAADLVASLAILTAVGLGQPLPGLVVVLMQTGGEALERYAARQASRAVEELEAAAPVRATRIRDGQSEEVAADLVQVGDLLLVRPGAMVPCDAEVVQGHSHVDASRLTGEPVPVSAISGVRLPSGSLNLESPLTVRALSEARQSQYARIVELVRSAAASKSPLLRMADRYAVWFTPLTLLVSGLGWFLSGDPDRALAVLVVATPCPLILAAPVAMIGGINRAARQGIIVRHGEALERLGTATTALLDKTGTLTVGHPEVSGVESQSNYTPDQILSYAAAVDSASGHALAQPIVRAARDRGVRVVAADKVKEVPGRGVTGTVEGAEIAIGSDGFLRQLYPALTDEWPPSNGGLQAGLTVNGAPGGLIRFADFPRGEAAELVQRLRTLGLSPIIMVTGDRAGHARAIAEAVGIADVRADLLAADKVRIVEELESAGRRVLMVGDGTNDAPALTRASVGVALAAHGGGISAEAADVVVLTDSPALVAEAISISRHTLRVARQSVWVGLGLSGVAMILAAAGFILPVAGAVLQEIIDVAAIVNALRASK